MFGLILPPNTSPVPRTSRRSHKKSRAGCLTCKSRKLKCDEAKPVCGNCLRHFVDIQSCDFGHRSTTQLRPLAAIAKSDHLSPRIADNRSNRREPSRSEEDCLPKSVAAERMDPFETYPESHVAGVDVLMKYYLHNAVYECFPWQPASDTNPTTKFYVPVVWRDRVLFHAALQLSAMRLQKSQAHSDIDSRQISGECIRLLRDRIESSNNITQVSDETISAVATLAAIEHERGNMKMLRMHLDGLKRMLDIRGGLSAIRDTNPMIANSVFWVFAMAMYEVPYPPLDVILPPFSPSGYGLHPSPPSQTISHFQDFGPDYDSSPTLEMRLLGVNQDIASVANSVQHVSQLVPTHSYPTATTSLVILTRICNLLSYLLSLGPIPATSLTDYNTLASESMRLCTLLHVFTPWRGLTPDGTISINLLLHSLISCLKLMRSAPEWSLNTITLWMFCTGAVAADSLPERSWFVGYLAEMTDEMEIRNWNQMKSMVSRIIWHERLCTPPYTKLWGEIEQKLTELGDV
ncbi:Sterol uptake control protein 2 [Lachnellula cervina]|uniref:Sterol uptake control protein 2 n=1 Tax=Lachnellula cervina TaxID=1316786 RepID=A0A7D8YRS7_9HELO|nr:Sterol uptake control protein 2 [Lachnellula cervina]